MSHQESIKEKINLRYKIENKGGQGTTSLETNISNNHQITEAKPQEQEVKETLLGECIPAFAQRKLSSLSEGSVEEKSPSAKLGTCGGMKYS